MVRKEAAAVGANDPEDTDRNRLAELERQKQYFESLVEISPVAIVTTDLGTNVTSWNPEAERLFGYTRDEAIGRKVDDLIAGADALRAEATEFVDQTSRTGRFRTVTRRMRKDGTLVDVDLLAVTVSVDGEPVGYYVLYNDIGELQRQTRSYEALVEMSPTAITSVDRDNRVASWNPAAEQLFGYSREEAIGRDIDELVTNSKEVRAEGLEVNRRAIEGPMSLVTRRTRKDGSLVDVEVRTAPLVVGGERIGLFALYHDISELQQRKRYYESLFELSPTAIATTDREANVTSWNPAAERLFGFTVEEAIGHKIDDLLASDARVHAEAVDVSAQNRAGEEVHLVTQRTRKDGSLVDVQVLAAPIVIGGEHVGSYALYHDISELQRQKRYYEALLESSPSAIVTLDLAATVMSWSPAAERLFGYSREEAIGRNIDELVANREEIRQEAEGVTREGEEGLVHLVTRRTRKDGTLVDVDVVGAQIVVGGERVGLYAIYTDVSELQRQKQYYASILEMSPTAIATIDPDANITSWNPAAERLFGYSRDEVMGQNIEELVAGRDELRAEAIEVTRRANEGAVSLITRRMRKDGSLVDVEVRGAAIVIAGEPIGKFALFHDITDLQEARREAEAATEAKSAFLATMSHEIRTPLNAVIGMTELLLGTKLDPEQRSFADVIRTSGEALLSVINDILDFSKIEAGSLDLESQPLDLRECVESAMEVIAPGAAAKGLDLAYLLRPGTPEALVGDATRLRQILLNLLNNAVKFTERGEVVLTVDSERLANDDESEGRYRFHLAVEDTGIGIPEDQMDRLFESFSQVDASTTRRYGGSGLGLAISKRLAEFMGGTMWVESRVGEGSTFHFTIDAEAAPRPVRAYDDSASPLLHKRVLILDDNATNRHILRAQTESWGMLARDTGSPGEALEWIRRGDPFDVAVLDMQMPEMDGLAVAREIRRHRDSQRLRLVLLTSLGRREEADDVQFAAYLTKPIRPSQLYDSLVEALGGQLLAASLQKAEPRAEVPAESTTLRVLVVEDNAVNQQLALLLLQKLGCRTDVAGTGLEALHALERESYEVVLMDVQMPEMDGLEATRRIHERQASARPHIIAATANATKADREHCLAAGMDDYLSKPIRMEELAAALARVPRATPVAALDASVVKRLRAAIGDVETAEMIDLFLAEAPKLIASLRESLERGDAETVRRSAHTLKSNAATFGASVLSDLCQELEASAEQGTLENARDLLSRVEAEYAQVRSSLAGARREPVA